MLEAARGRGSATARSEGKGRTAPLRRAARLGMRAKPARSGRAFRSSRCARGPRRGYSRSGAFDRKQAGLQGRARPIRDTRRKPPGSQTRRWGRRPKVSGSTARLGEAAPRQPARRSMSSTARVSISSKHSLVSAIAQSARPQLASRFCASNKSRKACASSFFSNTCGAMLRRVKAWPSFMRMNALVAKRVMVV